MNTAAISAIFAWIGGVISWLIAAAFDYQARAHAFSNARTQLQVELKYNPNRASEIGDVDEAAGNVTGGRSSFTESLAETYTQPLFVSSFTGVASLFAFPKNGELAVPLLLWLMVTALALIVTILNAKHLDSAKELRRWWVVVLAWVIVLATSLYSGWAASQGVSKP